MNKKEREERGKPLQVAPSLLAADFAHLADEILRIEQSGADFIHLDVMDGLFVPNLSMGPHVVEAVNRTTDLFLEVHLMIYHPFNYIERFVESGADRIIIHFEATEGVEETLNYIKKCNIQAGLAFSPETSINLAIKYLNLCDLLLVMTVKPGFGGQSFMEDQLEKVRFLRKICRELQIDLDLEVDGGIDEKSAPQCIEAGANILVAGTYLFKAKEMGEGVKLLKKGALNG